MTSLKPVAALPSVPTISESGLPGYEIVAWFALAAPKGTSREIVAALNQHFLKVLAVPDTVQKLEQAGIDVIGSTPAEAAAKLESELKKWATVVKERGMRAN